MEELIKAISERIQSSAPNMCALFDIYANEARFGRYWLNNSLEQVSKTDRILEIGGGMMLLACQLQKEGYKVSALEPVGDGFSHFTQLQKIVLEHAQREGFCPEIITAKAEELQHRNTFSFIYSINVMEHVDDVSLVVQNAYAALKNEGAYRFLCPNYAFPYESHFGIPAFGSKDRTWKIMHKSIQYSKKVPDPMGVWASLNWISVSQVKTICSDLLHTKPKFNNTILMTFIQRAMDDPFFKSRHNPLICTILRILSKLKLLGLTRLIPVNMLPIMDCTIYRKGKNSPYNPTVS